MTGRGRFGFGVVLTGSDHCRAMAYLTCGIVCSCRAFRLMLPMLLRLSEDLSEKVIGDRDVCMG